MSSLIISKKQQTITSCKVHLLHVKVCEVEKKVEEVFQLISDMSWVEKLNKDSAKLSYKNNAQRTIKDLAEGIFKNHGGKVTEDTGEYIISISAIAALNGEYQHTTLPISELWKEKVSGNHGFDFHSKTTDNLLLFGEAKYSSGSSSYGKAFDQIIEFVTDGKDVSDLVHLENFVGVFPIERFNAGFKAYSAAFSLKGKNIEKAMVRASKSKKIKPLLCHTELYLIGVEFAP